MYVRWRELWPACERKKEEAVENDVAVNDGKRVRAQERNANAKIVINRVLRDLIRTEIALAEIAPAEIALEAVHKFDLVTADLGIEVRAEANKMEISDTIMEVQLAGNKCMANPSTAEKAVYKSERFVTFNATRREYDYEGEMKLVFWQKVIYCTYVFAFSECRRWRGYEPPRNK